MNTSVSAWLAGAVLPAAIAMATAAVISSCSGADKGKRVTAATDTLSSSDAITSGDDPLATEVTRALPVVNLVKPGAAPRRELRLAYRAGTQVEVALRLSMGLKVSIDSVPVEVAVPATVTRALVEVTDASDDRFRVRYKIVAYDVEADENVEKAFAARYQGDLEKLIGLEGAGIIDTRGFVLATDFALPADAPTESVQSMEAVRDALIKFVVALPKEPIGVGGSWTVEERSESRGISSRMKSTYRVLALDGDAISVSQTVETHGVEGPIQSSVEPAGTSLTLVELAGRGAGEQTFVLTSPEPVAMAMSSSTMSRVNLTTADATQRIETDVRLELALMQKRPAE